jgi:hypothetical protein
MTTRCECQIAHVAMKIKIKIHIIFKLLLICYGLSKLFMVSMGLFDRLRAVTVYVIFFIIFFLYILLIINIKIFLLFSLFI